MPCPHRWGGHESRLIHALISCAGMTCVAPSQISEKLVDTRSPGWRVYRWLYQLAWNNLWIHCSNLFPKGVMHLGGMMSNQCTRLLAPNGAEHKSSRPPSTNETVRVYSIMMWICDGVLSPKNPFCSVFIPMSDNPPVNWTCELIVAVNNLWRVSGECSENTRHWHWTQCNGVIFCVQVSTLQLVVGMNPWVQRDCWSAWSQEYVDGIWIMSSTLLEYMHMKLWWEIYKS